VFTQDDVTITAVTGVEEADHDLRVETAGVNILAV